MPERCRNSSMKAGTSPNCIAAYGHASAVREVEAGWQDAHANALGSLYGRNRGPARRP